MVQATSVIDVTAEAVVEALESGAGQQAAGNQVWGLSFRDLQVEVQAALVRVRGPAVLMDHMRRLGFTVPQRTGGRPRAGGAGGGEAASAPEAEAVLEMELEQVARLMDADLAALLRNPCSTAVAAACARDATSGDTATTPPPLRQDEAPGVGMGCSARNGSNGSSDDKPSQQKGPTTAATAAGNPSCAHVTPQAVVALIERSVEALFASDRAHSRPRYGGRR